jgi:hypothetical protein
MIPVISLRRRFAPPTPVLACLLLAGCASVSVTPPAETARLAPTTPPTTLWVRDFSAMPGTLSVSAPLDSEVTAEQHLAALMSEGVTERWRKHYGSAGHIRAWEARPSGGLLVEGEIVRAKQGSRALRALVGLGLGGTKFETRVRVYNLDITSMEPWLMFSTTGGSNAQPGLLPGLAAAPLTGPIALPAIIPAAAPAVAQYAAPAGLLATGTSDDAKRTARMITAAIGQSLADRGLVKHKLRPKLLKSPAGR